MSSAYVHGYSEREAVRLADQAGTLSDLLHHDTVYPPGSRILECGCGTGAQTAILAARNPQSRIVSVDLSADSLALARERIEAAGFANVEFEQANLFDLPFDGTSFDHVFVCFVLEHVPRPEAALKAVSRVLRPGGTITAIEGDHGSWYCYPRSREASLAVECLVEAQRRAGGDALIGRSLYPLLTGAGYREVRVSPRMVYVDSSRPEMVEGFSKNTFIAMVEGVREEAIALGLTDPATWEKGIAGLNRATEADGTFCYTFFKGVGVK
jgi:SAM-dependent methyltransferase